MKTHYLFILIIFSSLKLVGQTPPTGYTLVGPEGTTLVLNDFSNLAYGDNGQYNYLNNQIGKITFNNTTFNGDPAPGTPKYGFYKKMDATDKSDALNDAIVQLNEHIMGTSPLAPSVIVELTYVIKNYEEYIGEDAKTVTNAFDLMDNYSNKFGLVFPIVNAKILTIQNLFTTDGDEIRRATLTLQQAMIDFLYSPENIKKHRNLLKNKFFLSSHSFPGECPQPVDPNKSYKTKINGSMPAQYGKRTAFSSTPSRKPTGYYLAPGSIGQIKVPASLVGKGFKILVGAHSKRHEQNNSGNIRRHYNVSTYYDITNEITEIGSPVGGGIYIITPYLANEGIVEITLQNVVPAPYFSYKSFDKTDPQEWLNILRDNPAPWADFESDRVLMQVPSSWIRSGTNVIQDPLELMKAWDTRMDAVSMITGYPHKTSRYNNHLLYIQNDLLLRAPTFGIGYPQINNIYQVSGESPGGQRRFIGAGGMDYFGADMHEMGHGMLASMFKGEGETHVNLIAVAASNLGQGVDIDSAFGNSRGFPHRGRDEAAIHRMVSNTFRRGQARDISSNPTNEIRYRLRGHAPYVDMAVLFGWESIGSFYRKEQLDFIAGRVINDGLSQDDSRIYRFAQSTGVDVRPLLHFWGIHPENPTRLEQLVQQENLPSSKLICERLKHYQSIIPNNNADFKNFSDKFWNNNMPSSTGNPNYGHGWFNALLPLYNTTYADSTKRHMQSVLDLYFPNGCPADLKTPIVTLASNKNEICAGDSIMLIASGADYYEWQGRKLEYDDTIYVKPTVSTTYSVIGKKRGYTSSTTTKTITVNPLPNVNLGNDKNVSPGQTVTLDAQDPNFINYEWSTGSTSPSIVVNSDSNTYWVTVTDQNGCVNSDTIRINMPLSLGGEIQNWRLSIWPNPTNGVINIQNSKEYPIKKMQLMDYSGKILQSKNAFSKDNIQTIDLTDLAAGNYIINITGENFSKAIPIIKQ